ncbi:MAG: hypothetical protein HKM95_02460 [Inquilinus sp.]|nr:hypothetical protein [Inquilinus sp.]
MDNFLKYYPSRCLECPELLDEATAGDRCAACVERARDAQAAADREPIGHRVAGHHDSVDPDPADEVAPKRVFSAG